MLRSFSVGKRAVESGSDILHAIDTYRIALKDRAEKTWFHQPSDCRPNSDGVDGVTTFAHLVVLKRPKISGSFPSLWLSTNTSSKNTRRSSEVRIRQLLPIIS